MGLFMTELSKLASNATLVIATPINHTYYLLPWTLLNSRCTCMYPWVLGSGRRSSHGMGQELFNLPTLDTVVLKGCMDTKVPLPFPGLT